MALAPFSSPDFQRVTRRWSFGECEFDEVQRELTVRRQVVDLESKPLDVLLHLLLHAGEVVTKEELLEAVWPDVAVVDGSLATAISKIRRVLGEELADAIVTIPRVGYRFALPVQSRPIASGQQPQLSLRPGEHVPGREHWLLKQPLDETALVWLAVHSKTRKQHVFKFAEDGLRLAALKREVTLYRYIAESLNQPAFIIPILEWNFGQSPFYVESEYGGLNLQEYADSAGGLLSIPLEERLRWMVEIAAAVGQAHDIGVLHKDLKPANILLRPVAEGEPPQVRLADFGSGTMQDFSKLRELGITNHGFSGEGHSSQELTGTLLYVSPEILAGHSATAAADIYSLGVLFYQLVAGDFRLPLTPGWELSVDDPLLSKDIAEAACGEPKRRMKSATELAERLATLKERRIQYNTLEVMRQRAEHAERMAANMRARRPWIITASAALLVGMLLSFGLYLRAIHERDIADRQTALANTINKFLSENLLGRGNPFRTGKAQESFTDAIKQAAPSIDAQFSSEPLVAARLHLTIARALDGRTNYVDARPEYIRASQLFRSVEGELSQDAILADLQRSNMQARAYQKDLLADAETLIAEQENRLSRIQNPREDLLVWKDSARGMLALVENDIGLAERSFVQALNRASTMPEFDQLARLNLQQRLAFTYIRRGDGVNAERNFQQLAAGYQKIEGPGGPDVLRIRLNLAQAYMVQNKHEQAIAEATAVYPLLVSALGADHELTLQDLTTRAQSEGVLGRWKDSIRDDLEVYRIAVVKQGTRSFFALGTLADAAQAQCRAEDYVEGLLNARKAYEGARDAFGPKSGLAGGIAYALAECDIAVGKLDEAAALLNTIDVPTVAQLASMNDWGANVSLARSEILFRKKKYADAREQLRQARPTFERAGAEPYQKAKLVELTNQLRQHP